MHIINTHSQAPTYTAVMQIISRTTAVNSLILKHQVLLALCCLMELRDKMLLLGVSPVLEQVDEIKTYLTVAPSEALAARAGVLPGVLWPASGGEGHAQPPIEAGAALAGIRTRCGLGWGGLGRCWGVRGQLERGRDGPVAAAQEQEKKQGVCDASYHLIARTHPDPLTLVLCFFPFVWSFSFL